MERRLFRYALAVAALALPMAVALADRAQSPAPYGLNDAGGFLNVLPAGEQGVDNALQFARFEATGAIPQHFDDQLAMYENLEYAAPTLTNAQVPAYFKDATFGVQDRMSPAPRAPSPG